MQIIDRPPKGVRFKNLSGQQFSGIGVVKLKGFDRHNIAHWDCRCHCGKEMVCSGSHLLSGHTTSCGCSRVTHGHTRGKAKTPEYAAWKDMLRRCYNPSARSYRNYGLRGITVCSEWRESFEAFISDIGTRPSSEYTLGRIDNEMGYSKSNCRWETVPEQNVNKRNNHWVLALGRKQTISQWASEIGCTYHSILGPIRRGRDPESVILNAIRASLSRKAEAST